MSTSGSFFVRKADNLHAQSSPVLLFRGTDFGIGTFVIVVFSGYFGGSNTDKMIYSNGNLFQARRVATDDNDTYQYFHIIRARYYWLILNVLQIMQ